uniref:Integrase catalytic domain-containing protein n=1 Tax=Tanacetum cinerariifolium TaxID=118510 RepID=A0A699IB99_TANCI|nr:hypothetical protein [Tanacetum cinerariifolium]
MFDCDDYLSSGSDESLPPSPIYDRYQSGNGYHVVPPPYTGTFMPPKPDLVFSNAPNDVETDHSAFNVKLSPIKPDQDLSHTHRPSAPIIDDWVSNFEDESEIQTLQNVPTVLTRSKLVPITAVRPVTTDVPKISVTRPRQAKTIITKPNSPPRRHINRSPSPKASNFPPKVTAVKASMVNAAKELNGRYVAFGGNPKGGKISGKGKIKTGKLDFDDVYFVKELKFNIFSVSQMCDKKNSVLFTNTECLVLSFEFKLPDENQVLLRVHRENNMYNGNLKNIIPFEDLTYLFAKATIDESKLWHRRLGYINFKTMNKLVKGLENQLSFKVKVIRSDNRTEFKNHDLNQFCGMKGIKMEFSVPRTPQQNGITERKNRTLIEAASILADSLLPIPFWAEAVNTAYSLGKFDGKVDEGFLVGYSVISKAFRVFNSRTQIVQETLHVNFLENKPNVASSGPTWLFDIDTHTRTMNCQPVSAGNQSNPSAGVQDQFDVEKAGEIKQQYPEFEGRKPESEVNVSPISIAQSKKHAADTFQLLDDPNMPELEDITYSDDDEDVGAEVDFNNLETSITVSPIPTTRVHKDHPVTQIIGDLSLATQTRSMTRVAKDQEPKRVHQALKDPSWIKAIHEELLQFKMQKVWVLVDLPYGKRDIGHTHEEGIDNEEVFAPVARIEAIRLFLAYASFMGFMVYQMDVKSAFLYGTIKEEVYVCQPLGFEDPGYPDKVYKVVKVLYGYIKLLELDRKSASTPIDTEKPLLKDPDVKRFFRYLKGKPHLGLWYPKDSPFDLVAYLDSDYAGASLDRKSTTEGCQFHGCRLISWQCKKQAVMATSSTKAEYVAAASCCT